MNSSNSDDDGIKQQQQQQQQQQKQNNDKDSIRQSCVIVRIRGPSETHRPYISTSTASSSSSSPYPSSYPPSSSSSSSHPITTQSNSHANGSNGPSAFSHSFYFVLNNQFECSLGLVVLKVNESLRAIDSAYRNVLFGNSLAMHSGSPVTVVASPFGYISPTIFLNSLSTGVICNCIQERTYSQPSLYLTDARCLPGSEGGGVFDNDGRLVGVVATPIKSKDDKSPFNLTPLIPVHTFIMALEKLSKKENINLFPGTTNIGSGGMGSLSSSFPSPCPSSDGLLTSLKNKIVLVKFKDTWGSGVIISDDGYVLTNAHLLTPTIPALKASTTAASIASLQSPTVSLSENSYPPSLFENYQVDIRVNFASIVGKEAVEGHSWYRGAIEYISHTHLDIALLRIKRHIESDRFHHVTCNTLANPKHGTKVSVLGFPLVPPSQNPSISVTSGIISNIVCIDGCAVSYQTTAPVHSGNSGGGLFDLNGNFLGVVTCNAKQKNGSIITDLNFSIPTTSLQSFITKFSSPAKAHNIGRNHIP
ncbi:hypothetical protein DFA_04054 [Cavenderia fasciculata]|uniref:Uncharacterized protein n=1 Tax=Cavenderia fasciculata TaxID=261658 RepID=F4Q159_CACFS|nr:uncharacterized protein DFA_04054 [Cavenderia fasciculata]EGG18560.1 hypothetical protein DFA_04054 [Cavenderia fasciculata]|eukprot:XP_004366464.1 hypothetical protein DFA_04054 [Cavenderia fasciculata]